MTTLTKSEYARLRGCSPAYVAKLIRQGRVALTKEGKVHVEATDQLIENTTKLRTWRDRETVGESSESNLIAQGIDVRIPDSFIAKLAAETDPTEIRLILEPALRGLVKQVIEHGIAVLAKRVLRAFGVRAKSSWR